MLARRPLFATSLLIGVHVARSYITLVGISREAPHSPKMLSTVAIVCVLGQEFQPLLTIRAALTWNNALVVDTIASSKLTAWFTTRQRDPLHVTFTNLTSAGGAITLAVGAHHPDKWHRRPRQWVLPAWLA